MSFSVTAAFFVYFSILLVICYFAHRKNETESDFVIGSRSLNFWLTAFSAHAADMSAWLFMAFPTMIFIGGMPHIWVALGLLFGKYLNWQFIAPNLRRKTEEKNSDTLSKG
jgi:SSS family solute:Na+ symporter